MESVLLKKGISSRKKMESFAKEKYFKGTSFAKDKALILKKYLSRLETFFSTALLG